MWTKQGGTLSRFWLFSGQSPHKNSNFFCKTLMRCCQIMCLKLNLHKKFNFFCCSIASIVRTVFAFFFLALYLCDRLRVLSVRKEAALVWKWQHSQHYMAQLFSVLKNNKTKRYYDRNFHGKMVSKDKRKGLPTKTRNINPLCGSEINTSPQ